MAVFAFADMTLDTEVFELRRDGTPVRMEPQTFDVLVYLVRNRDRVVSKEELMDEVWGGRFVSETAVTSRIKQVRRALGDDGTAQRFVKTVHGRGYRFVIDAEEVASAPTSSAPVRPEVGSRAVPSRGHAAPAVGRRGPVRYTSVDGLHIAYQVSGPDSEDRPDGVDVVLVAGFISHLEIDWDEPRHVEFLDGIGSLGRLIRFDKRGTGMSDRPQGLPDLEVRMHDVLAVMDAVGSERAVLVGYSEGGPMATLFAAAHPERTIALVLYGSYAKRIRSADHPWARDLDERRAYTRELATKWDWESDMLLRCPSADESMCRWWARRARAATTPSTLDALMEMNALVDIRDVLGAVRVPTLVMHRKGDEMVRIEDGRYLADNIPNAVMLELDGDDHFVSGDPEQLVQPIQQFARRLPVEQATPDLALAAVTAIAGVDATEHADRLVRQGGTWRRPIGDVHLVTFDGPATALRAVLADPSDARIGVNVAEVARNRGQVSGPGVDRAVELTLSAAPGEVRVSGLVRDLLAGSGIGVEAVTPEHDSGPAYRLAQR